MLHVCHQLRVILEPVVVKCQIYLGILADRGRLWHLALLVNLGDQVILEFLSVLEFPGTLAGQVHPMRDTNKTKCQPKIQLFLN